MKLLLPILFLSALGDVAFGQSGLIIYKDAPWDQDQFARSVLYKKVSRFPTVYNVEPMTGKAIRVSSSLVLKDLPFPSAESLRDISDEPQIKAVEALVKDWETALKRFPQTAKVVKPRLAELQNDLAQFQSGKVKSEGQWMTRDEYAAKQKRIAEEKARIAAKVEEELKRREAMVADWEKMDAADRQRMKEARLASENANLAATQEQRIEAEIKRLEAIAAKRAQMKPAERLSTDTWVTPPGLNEEQTKKFGEALLVAKEQLAKGKESIGYGLECQRIVVTTPKHVYAFKASDVLPKPELIPGDEKAETQPGISISCPEDKRGIDRFPMDGSAATSLPSVTIPLAKEVDAKKLAEALTHILELAAPRKEVTAVAK